MYICHYCWPSKNDSPVSMAQFTLQAQSRAHHIPNCVYVPVHTPVTMVKAQQHWAPFGLVQANYFISHLAPQLHSDCLAEGRQCSARRFSALPRVGVHAIYFIVLHVKQWWSFRCVWRQQCHKRKSANTTICLMIAWPCITNTTI